MRYIHKFMRYFVYFIYIAILRFTPEIYRPYRAFFPWLRRICVSLFLEKCGKKITVKHNADISPHIEIGDYSELGTRCMIQSHIKIGNNVIMGPDVKIYSRNHKYSSLIIPIQFQGKIQKYTKVGNDVWLGANVVILPGVEIGDHVIIGAGSIVTNNIPDWAVAAGNPAKVIKLRK